MATSVTGRASAKKVATLPDVPLKYSLIFRTVERLRSAELFDMVHSRNNFGVSYAGCTKGVLDAGTLILANVMRVGPS